MANTARDWPQNQAGGGTTSSHAVQNYVSTASPIILSYLGSVADGRRRLDPVQISEIKAWQSKAGQTEYPADSEMQDGQDVHEILDFRIFLDYMASPASNAIGPLEEIDLRYPISNYFISSSHNTYLTGNQLYSSSSTDTYRNVLLRGCRCVEIDVWDGEPKTPKSEDEGEESHGFRSHLPSSISSHFSKHHHKEGQPSGSTETSSNQPTKLPTPWVSMSTATRAEPRVLHGYTMTKEVPFRDVCEAIRDSAFVTSNLPVIVSLELHAGSEQQEIMVEIMEETWKGMLMAPQREECLELPCPADLMGQILVKVKHVALDVAASSSPPAAQGARFISSSSSSSESEDHSSNNGHKLKKKKKKSKVIEDLGKLGVYTRSYHFQSLSAPEATVPTHVFALSEKKLMEVHRSQGPTLFSHNRNFMMRAYPAGTRLSSSNLDPSFFWRKGVQMVALNWQKWDEGMMLNEAMFAGSGGWILKPEGYRGSTKRVTKVSNESQADAIPHKVLDLVIEVFAGQNLPLPLGDVRPERFHPYVKCELHVEKPEERSGAPIKGGGRSKEGEHKQRSKTSKGIQPDFGGELMEFIGIPGVVEELSFVRFKIQDDDIGKDDLAAWACIRLDRLQVGYRFVHLLDAKGIEGNGILLVNITKHLA